MCVKMAAPKRPGPRKRRISPVLIIGGSASLALTLCIFSAHHVSINTPTITNTRTHTGAGSVRQPLRPASNNNVVPTTKRSLSLDTKCQMEYERVNRHRTNGLSEESIARSRAWVGNRQRLDHLAGRLTSPSANGIDVITFGGSITLGHGVARNATPGYKSGPYGLQLEGWLNDMYGGNDRKHTVHNLASHGADMCALEKRITGILAHLERKDIHPDLFLLEFAVNDYQGQDHMKHVDSKTDQFFDGFQSIALCCEVVIYKLLHSFPHATIAFLEFRTAITSRKTAQLLHLGVAQHYEVPVISYAEAMFPEYFRLISMLNGSIYCAEGRDTHAISIWLSSMLSVGNRDQIQSFSTTWQALSDCLRFGRLQRWQMRSAPITTTWTRLLLSANICCRCRSSINSWPQNSQGLDCTYDIHGNKRSMPTEALCSPCSAHHWMARYSNFLIVAIKLY